jgi:hypothetical protein
MISSEQRIVVQHENTIKYAKNQAMLAQGKMLNASEA